MSIGYLKQPYRHEAARENCSKGLLPVSTLVVAKEVTGKGRNSKRVEPMGLENNGLGSLF